MARQLSPQIQVFDDFVVAFKPKGLTTHQSDPVTPGFVEFLEIMRGENLYVVHRLDKETSGVMIFARSKTAAAQLTELFANGKIKKEYLFITRSAPPSETRLQVKSTISKNGKTFQSRPSDSPDAITDFEYLRSDRQGRHSLWKASPLTGKTHQIRLHAKSLGQALLGDEIYEGADFPVLALIAHRLEFFWNGERYEFTFSIPNYFEDLEKLKNPETCYLEEQIRRRQHLYQIQQNQEQTLRLLHDHFLGWRADLLGPVLWIHWFNDEEPTLTQIDFFKDLGQRLSKNDLVINHLRKIKDSKPTVLYTSQPEPFVWTANEEDRKFQFRTQSGVSPGLFLDQRENRNWIQKVSSGKRVLNLFSYTGGFSLAAALGGAKEVVTVDLSKTFLTWSKENFKLNGLNPAAYEFYQSDALFFVRGAKKKNRFFDLIICDPPSFSRSPEGVFRIEKDLSRLIGSLLEILAPEGEILFSTNYESWTPAEFLRACEKAVPLKHRCTLHQNWSYDFELPGREAVMKTVRVM